MITPRRPAEVRSQPPVAARYRSVIGLSVRSRYEHFWSTVGGCRRHGRPRSACAVGRGMWRCPVDGRFERHVEERVEHRATGDVGGARFRALHAFERCAELPRPEQQRGIPEVHTGSTRCPRFGLRGGDTNLCTSAPGRSERGERGRAAACPGGGRAVRPVHATSWRRSPGPGQHRPYTGPGNGGRRPRLTAVRNCEPVLRSVPPSVHAFELPVQRVRQDTGVVSPAP